MTGPVGVGAAAAVLLLAANAIAQSPPSPVDMKGTWKGTSEGIGIDATGKIQLGAATYTYRIEGQDGKRFWGTASSERGTTERLVGSLSNDGKWIYMAGQDGILDGQFVDADTFEMCYRHANATSAVVGCNRMVRQK